MEKVAHRELRNHSAEVLRRVEAGESLQITNRGRPVARLVPLHSAVLADLLSTGSARPALADVSTLTEIQRVRADNSTAQMVEDVRRRW